MKQQLENWDPFRLANRPKYKKSVMLLLYVAIGATAISLFLYLILGIFSDRNSKLSHYSKQVREWKKTGESFKLSDISVALKIMPSENTRGNMVVMTHRTEDMLKERKLSRIYNYSQSYFFHTNTTMYFPVFHYEVDNVPVGDSEIYCMHLFWTPNENEQTLELYESVKGFPQCTKAFNPRVIWHQHDPKYGSELNTWKQEVRALEGCNTREACQKKCNKYAGIAKRTRQKEYMCYSYKVLTDICLTLYYNTTDSWTYAGGCFENGSPVHMASAKPGQTYNFEDVTVQVRSRFDPYVVAAKENTESDDLSFGLDIDFIYTFAFLILFVAILCGVVVAAAVILEKYIVQTQLYEKFFRESPVLETGLGVNA
ncbi:MAG: hypothetical protein P4L10_13410 [Acidobacteriaceae bacterium]|nr:hypothetical protein [Acidobacteriaceae bacterium]